MPSTIPYLVKEYESQILTEWLDQQKAALGSSTKVGEGELREQSRAFLSAFQVALQTGDFGKLEGAAWGSVKEFLSDLSTKRARQGFTPSETATFVFSLKQPIFERIRSKSTSNAQTLEETTELGMLLDKLGLYTMELYQKGREEIISRQQEEMLELSTPVVKLWDGILALPMIGTLDSSRTQIVMESLLQKIVETEALVAIIDITGVSTVDTLVAQHLMKTVQAARLMGADCIISGIRPQIAQTIVHLAIDLGSITTKATMADAFAVALERRGMYVTSYNKQRRGHTEGVTGLHS